MFAKIIVSTLATLSSLIVMGHRTCDITMWWGFQIAFAILWLVVWLLSTIVGIVVVTIIMLVPVGWVWHHHQELGDILRRDARMLYEFVTAQRQPAQPAQEQLAPQE